MVYRCKLDAQWTMEYVNSRLKGLTGYLPGDLVQNKLIAYADIIHPADKEYVQQEVEKQIRDLFNSIRCSKPGLFY